MAKVKKRKKNKTNTQLVAKKNNTKTTRRIRKPVNLPKIDNHKIRRVLFSASYFVIPFILFYFISPIIKNAIVNYLSSSSSKYGFTVMNSNYSINHVIEPFASCIAYFALLVLLLLVEFIVRFFIAYYGNVLYDLNVNLLRKGAKLLEVAAICGALLIASYSGFDPQGYGIVNATNAVGSETAQYSQIEDVPTIYSTGLYIENENGFYKFCLKTASVVHSISDNFEMYFAIVAGIAIPINGVCSTAKKLQGKGKNFNSFSELVRYCWNSEE